MVEDEGSSQHCFTMRVQRDINVERAEVALDLDEAVRRRGCHKVISRLKF